MLGCVPLLGPLTWLLGGLLAWRPLLAGVPRVQERVQHGRPLLAGVPRVQERVQHGRAGWARVLWLSAGAKLEPSSEAMLERLPGHR